MKVYIGYDKREHRAYEAAQNTLKARSGLTGEPLCADRLRSVGLYNRSVDHRHGGFYDLPSNAPAATEFATSRFLVPILCQSGLALFTDCDVLFLTDVRRLIAEADPTKAVSVVKHPALSPTKETKMDGQPQTKYSRKNWSSVMLFNCDHPANQRLTLYDVNTRPGRDLHRFYWLHDDEIGELDPGWNWLVNVRPKPEEVMIAHYTLGGPWLPAWDPRPYDDLWIKEEAIWRPTE